MSAPHKQNFRPFAPEVFHAPSPNPHRGCSTEDSLAALEELFATAVAPDRAAAMIVEPVQGNGGFLPALLREIALHRVHRRVVGVVERAGAIQPEAFRDTGEVMREAVVDVAAVAAGLPGRHPPGLQHGDVGAALRQFQRRRKRPVKPPPTTATRPRAA